MLPRISGGKPSSIMPAVTNIYQAKRGIWDSFMPGARMRKIVVSNSTAPHTAEISAKVMPISQISFAMSGLYRPLDNGTYMNQPLRGASPRTRLNTTMVAPNR